MSELKGKKAMLDTSFIINLVNEAAPFHKEAVEYFKRLLEDGYKVLVSAIALSEYAVKDSISSLPLKYLRIVAFNHKHAEKSGLFGRAVKGCRKEDLQCGRAIVLNDSKIFAQAEAEGVDYIISADAKAEKVYGALKDAGIASAAYIDISKIPVNSFAGVLF